VNQPCPPSICLILRIMATASSPTCRSCCSTGGRNWPWNDHGGTRPSGPSASARPTSGSACSSTTSRWPATPAWPSSPGSAFWCSPGCTPPSSPADHGGTDSGRRPTSRPQAELCGSLAVRAVWPPVRGRRRPPVRAALVLPTTSGGVGQSWRPTASAIPAPEATPGPRHGCRHCHRPSPYLLVPSRAEVLLLREVTMWSSQAGGIEGHQWSLHRTSGTRLPCRIVCQCGWTSTAGHESSVLLQLKGHLEDSLRNGARLLPAHDQPLAEIPNTPST
jgi:hypothetical protein